MIKGKHLINGKWVNSSDSFNSTPAFGDSHNFAKGTIENVKEAVLAAEEAFLSYGYSSREIRAEFLNNIADEIEKRGAELTKIGHEETALPEARLKGERGRTTMQLRIFASHILSKEYLDIRHDKALPERKPIPRPEMYLMQRPIGPVAVFEASNFPLAFSTAGGDTAAALAAGCPVVVKSHSAHPGTSELVAQAIEVAIKKSGLHLGVFALLQGGDRSVGAALVTNRLIKAVGFTGSLAGGRTLFDLCAKRNEPIPFFGELGSVNPMFFMKNSLNENAKELANSWVQSLTMGAGQFCTNPGISVVLKGASADEYIKECKNALSKVHSQTMLTDGISKAYREGQERISGYQGVQELFVSTSQLRNANPLLYATSGEQWLNNEQLGEEVFGPLGIIVIAKSFSEILDIARSLKGQLTCTIHMNEHDTNEAEKLLPILERKAGRILVNGFPTGVEVNDSIVHGGPYPASTNFGATSVGTMSIRRFLRPVCYQNIPMNILPNDLK